MKSILMFSTVAACAGAPRTEAGETSGGGESPGATDAPPMGPGTAVEGSSEGSDGGSTAMPEVDESSTGTPLPMCGNGIVEPGEECDDGNTYPADACTAACTDPCGDGLQEVGGELCLAHLDDLPTGKEPVDLLLAPVQGVFSTDLVVCNAAGDSLSVFYRDEDGGLADPFELEACDEPRGADFGVMGSALGATAIAIACGSGDVALLPSADGGGLDAPTLYPVADGLVDVRFGDWTGDGVVDIAAPSAAEGALRILVGDHFAPPSLDPTPIPVGASPSALASPDLDLDRYPDLLVGSADPFVFVVHGSPAGLEPPVDFGLEGTPVAVAAGDVDVDGLLDLVTLDQDQAALSILRGLAEGGYGAPESIPVGERPVGLAVADLNHDGARDFVVTDAATDEVHVLLGDGDAGVAHAVAFPVGAEPVDVMVFDFTGDGLDDVLTANRGDDTLTLLGSSS